MSFMITACVPATTPRNAPRSRKPLVVDPDDGVYEECVPGSQLQKQPPPSEPTDVNDYAQTGCHLGYIFKRTLQSCIGPASENDKKLSGAYTSYERPEETESMILDNALFEPKKGGSNSIGSNSNSSKTSGMTSLSSGPSSGESATTGPMAKFARTSMQRNSLSKKNLSSSQNQLPPSGNPTLGNYALRQSSSPELDAIVNLMNSAPSSPSHNYLSINSDDYETSAPPQLNLKPSSAVQKRQMMPTKPPERNILLPPSGKLWGRPITMDWKSSLRDPFRNKKKFAGPALEKVYELPEKEALYDISQDLVLSDLARAAREIREVKELRKDNKIISADDTYPLSANNPVGVKKTINHSMDVMRRLNSFSVTARVSPDAQIKCSSLSTMIDQSYLDNVMSSLTLSDSSGSQKPLLSLGSNNEPLLHQPQQRAGEIDIRDDGIIYSIEKVRQKGKRPVEMNPVPLCVPGMQGFVPPYCRVSAVRARRALIKRHGSRTSRGSKTYSDTTWASSEARRKRRLKPASCKAQDHYCRDIKVTPCVSTLRKKKSDFEKARKRANVGANKGQRKKAYVFNWLLVNQGVVGNATEKERARRLAKERSTLLWLLAKAHKGRIPIDLRSPHYKESESQYRLKPDIVDLLSSCKMYCMVLRNLYEDSAYSELTFDQIFTMLERKGIEIKPLKGGTKVTPATLEECSPLNMSAHLNFSDGLMELFIREVLIPSKVFHVVERFTPSANNGLTGPASVSSLTKPGPPADAEDAAILWINRSAQALREKVHAEHKVMLPKVVHVQDLSDLSDGSALASLISLYCPHQLPFQDITFSPSMSLSDSLSNQHRVKDFCERHLPQDVHLVCLEDMLFLHAGMRTNVLAFLADLMYLFEIRPFKAVQVPGVAQYIIVKRESRNTVTEL